ncbi:hypothetical protein ACHQM5_022408 [Ranunculus cassubicifolius]
MTIQENPAPIVAIPAPVVAAPVDPVDDDAVPTSKKLTLLPLIFLIFYEVSGGPFGEEEVVHALGPLFSILGFVIFPFIWSIPEALITAELATAYPGNGGFIIWVDQAFGPFWGTLMGLWKFFSGVINNAAYPNLCSEYLQHLFPVLGRKTEKNLSIILFTLVLSFLNYIGLNIVGYAAVALAIISISPFFVMAAISIPSIRPRRWLSRGDKERFRFNMDNSQYWRRYFNTLFWNLNFWDNASTLAGEVENPQTMFPKALVFGGILTIVCYLTPLISVLGALELEQESWGNGYLAVAAGKIGGNWLKVWVELGAVLSTVGLFEAQLSSCSFALLGMADLGFLPKFFACRSKFGTPGVGILICTMISFGFSFRKFEDIISAANLLYAIGMLLEIAAFIWLRKKSPDVNRPYKVPMGMVGICIMCSISSVFFVGILCVATSRVYAIFLGLTILGVVGYFFLKLCKSKNWVEFNELREKNDGDSANLEVGQMIHV